MDNAPGVGAIADHSPAGPRGASKDVPITRKIIEIFSDPWVLFGLAAQGVFMLRFVIQWIASERRKRSYVPVAFWYFSLLGGLMLLSYAIKKADPVFILGQGLGCFIYVRNLRLIQKRKSALRRANEARRLRGEPDPADAVFDPAQPELPATAQPSP